METNETNDNLHQRKYFIFLELSYNIILYRVCYIIFNITHFPFLPSYSFWGILNTKHYYCNRTLLFLLIIFQQNPNKTTFLNVCYVEIFYNWDGLVSKSYNLKILENFLFWSWFIFTCQLITSAKLLNLL